MPKFVKLTHLGRGHALWLNMEKIVAFYASCGGTYLDFDQDIFHHVKETPEQILALIEGVNQ